MNLYVADTHFGHRGAIDVFDRPFETLEAMDVTMARGLLVAEGRGTVYHLGDLTLDPASRLPGRIGMWFAHPDRHTLVAGNHEQLVRRPDAYEGLFGRVVGTEEGWTKNRLVVEDELHGESVRVLLSHAPQADLEGADVNLHGHLHTRAIRHPGVAYRRWPFLRASTRHLNVSVELIDYRPHTLEELVEMRDWMPEFI